MENAAAATIALTREARKRRCTELLAPEGSFECHLSSSDAPDADVDADVDADADVNVDADGLSFGLESVSVGTTPSGCSDADGDEDVKAERELLNAAASGGGAGSSHAVFASPGAQASDWQATASGALAALDGTCVKARPAMHLGDDLRPQQVCGVCEDTAAGAPIIVPCIVISMQTKILVLTNSRL